MHPFIIEEIIVISGNGSVVFQELFGCNYHTIYLGEICSLHCPAPKGMVCMQAAITITSVVLCFCHAI